MIVLDLGVIEYGTAWDRQRDVFEKVLAGGEDHILICEHPHVYTLGNSGKAANLLISDEFLRQIGATYFKTDRGGDITYHGFGQVVVYPIVNVRRLGIGLRRYIEILEEAIIDTVACYGIKAQRLDGATGVWVMGGLGDLSKMDSSKVGDGFNTGAGERFEMREDLKARYNDVSTTFSNIDRKIAALGVKASHDITMHGLAMNVNTDLKYFNYINPCGFVDKGVTSISKECNGREIDFEEAKKIVVEHLIKKLIAK